MIFILQARTPNVRKLAGKFAEILDGLKQDQVEIGAVAARIKELGGIDAAYETVRARTMRHESCVTQDSQNKGAPPMEWKSKQLARPTTRTAKLTDEDRSNFDGEAAGPRPAYIDLLFGGKIRLSPVGPPSSEAQSSRPLGHKHCTVQSAAAAGWDEGRAGPP
jgi:hypothetical protein